MEKNDDLFESLIEKAVNDRCEKEDLLRVWSNEAQKRQQTRRIFFRVSGIAACLVCVTTIISFWGNDELTESGQAESGIDDTVIPMQPSVGFSIPIDSIKIATDKDSIDSDFLHDDENY